ncbi:hypothetical protein FQN53_003385 [Emmonsiellopsis sp. PD_33]|nr:hypothetical protein FQN53_003385 [Emmonsiellopsis sp. PD_33]
MSELLTYLLANEESFRRSAITLNPPQQLYPERQRINPRKLTTQSTNNRARLPSLYSDFSTQRHTNPDGYATNIAAWQRALAHAALAGVIHSSSSSASGRHGHSEEDTACNKSDLLVLRVNNALIAELETAEWGRPVALGTVVDEAIRSNTMIPLETFHTSVTSPFITSWIRLPSPPTLSQVMGWSMKQLRGFISDADGSGRLQARNLVLVDNLKAVAKSILAVASKSHNTSMDCIYSKEMFTKRFARISGAQTHLSPLDIDVLLTFLSRDENAIIYDGETIKFKTPGDKTATLTPHDRTIASLKTVIATLTLQTTQLTTKITTLTQSAQTALANKNRILALSSLRSKKLAEHNLKQRTDTLLQLEEVYMKLEQAADQVEIVRVMEASTGALRSLRERVGGVERVEDVVEELRGEMGKVDEIGGVISEAALVVDEGELDEELEAMEMREREARDVEEAEATRRRLVELERFEVEGREREREAEQKEKEKENVSAGYDSDLDDSIGKLSQMSIEDNPKEKERKAGNAEKIFAE